MERWKKLDEEEKQQELDAEFKQKLEANETEEELKTAQRRKKRQRQKEAKQRKHNLQLAGVNIEQSVAGDADEFSYTPVYKHDETKEEVGIVVEEPSKLEFANDGSFLEMMKKQFAEKTALDQRQNADDEPPAKKRATERVES
jgi:Protein of unknown function (DUF1168)